MPGRPLVVGGELLRTHRRLSDRVIGNGVIAGNRRAILDVMLVGRERRRGRNEQDGRGYKRGTPQQSGYAELGKSHV